jgi:serine/threonine-protein kinase RsbT
MVSITRIREPVRLRVTEEHHIAWARQAAVKLAETIGFGGVGTASVVTSVSELAANLVFHTLRGGTLTIVPVWRHGAIGLEVIAEDEGPGIPDVSRAMQDGFSTNGGLGSGLPGVQRLMDEFEITSAVGIGTRIITRKWQPCR